MIGLINNMDTRHGHLNKDKLIYVAVWVGEDMAPRIMEECYVGAHENADYRQIN
jgi:hypothetical protein